MCFVCIYRFVNPHLQPPGSLTGSISPVLHQQCLDRIGSWAPVQYVKGVGASWTQRDGGGDQRVLRLGGAGDVYRVGSASHRAEAGRLIEVGRVKIDISDDRVHRPAVVGQIADPETCVCIGRRAGGVGDRCQIQSGGRIDHCDGGHAVSDIHGFLHVGIAVSDYGKSVIAL